MVPDILSKCILACLHNHVCGLAHTATTGKKNQQQKDCMFPVSVPTGLESEIRANKMYNACSGSTQQGYKQPFPLHGEKVYVND